MHDLPTLARKAEKENRWREAERIWRSAGMKSDADACKSIADSTELGDKYRARVLAEAGPEPDPGTEPFKFVEWYKKMNKIYNEMFRA